MDNWQYFLIWSVTPNKQQTMENKQKLVSDLQKISAELDSCVRFWTQHSHDEEHGWGGAKYFCNYLFWLCSGFFNCLSSDGSVYDTTKYWWLQGRWVKKYTCNLGGISNWWKYIIGVWLTFQASSWSDLRSKLYQLVDENYGSFHLMIRYFDAATILS